MADQDDASNVHLCRRPPIKVRTIRAGCSGQGSTAGMRALTAPSSPSFPSIEKPPQSGAVFCKEEIYFVVFFAAGFLAGAFAAVDFVAAGFAAAGLAAALSVAVLAVPVNLTPAFLAIFARPALRRATVFFLSKPFLTAVSSSL